MNAVFADTSFFLALLRKGDPLHLRAIAEWRANRPVVTTEFVVLELGNACARALDHADFLALVAGIRTNPRISTIPLDSRLLDRGLDRMADRPDKDWSLTDCISFVVMEGEGIREALTGDREVLVRQTHTGRQSPRLGAFRKFTLDTYARILLALRRNIPTAERWRTRNQH